MSLSLSPADSHGTELDFLKASIHYTCLISVDAVALVLFTMNIAATPIWPLNLIQNEGKKGM